jgi:hypothetical protein
MLEVPYGCQSAFKIDPPVQARMVEAVDHKPARALLPHVAERHRRAGWVVRVHCRSLAISFIEPRSRDLVLTFRRTFEMQQPNR